MDMKKLFVPCS